MERFGGLLDPFKDKELKLDIGLTAEASEQLRRLILLPNPDLTEFAFFGLGKEGLIDSILTADEKHFRTGSGVVDVENGIKYSKINPYEFENLFHELGKTKRVHDLMVIGHFHPLMTKNIEALLLPSTGDIDSFKVLAKEIPELLTMYMGIAADTKKGPMLRLYRIGDIIQVNTFKDLKKILRFTTKI